VTWHPRSVHPWAWICKGSVTETEFPSLPDITPWTSNMYMHAWNCECVYKKDLMLLRMFLNTSHSEKGDMSWICHNFPSVQYGYTLSLHI
jgi:hypothetical protein